MSTHIPFVRPETVIKDDDVLWTMNWSSLKSGIQRPDVQAKPVEEIQFEEGPALARMLAEGSVILNSNWYQKEWPEDAKDTFSFAVNCSDFFAYSCADAEEFKHEDLRSVYDAWILGDLHLMRWCCLHRKQKPIQPWIDRFEKSGLWDESCRSLPDNTLNALVQDSFRELHNKPK